VNVGDIIKKALRISDKNASSITPKPKRRSERDIYFTDNFYTRAAEWHLTEEHARYVFYEGDPVKGKENMKVATYQDQAIGIYVFRDRETNQPVITSIWKRKPVAASKPRR
jgi:hypothetical protein